ncbi:hypothetical protein KI387_033836, partial [Taxus chinensis]
MLDGMAIMAWIHVGLEAYIMEDSKSIGRSTERVPESRAARFYPGTVLSLDPRWIDTIIDEDDNKKLPMILISLKMADNRSLEGHVAIVTGASCGVGKEIAIHLAQKGAKLVINYVENVEKEEEVASIINGDDCTVLKAITCKADVSKASKMSSLFDGDEEAFRKNAHILTAYIALYVNIVHFSFSTVHLLLHVTDNNPHPHLENTFNVTMVYKK